MPAMDVEGKPRRLVSPRAAPTRSHTPHPHPSDLFNDDFSYKRKLKIKLPTPDGVVSTLGEAWQGWMQGLLLLAGFLIHDVSPFPPIPTHARRHGRAKGICPPRA